MAQSCKHRSAEDYLTGLQTLFCPQSVIFGGTRRVGWLGCPCDPVPAEVCGWFRLQATEGALESALPFRWTGAVYTGRHHNVIDGYVPLITPHHSFYNKLGKSLIQLIFDPIRPINQVNHFLRGNLRAFLKKCIKLSI